MLVFGTGVNEEFLEHCVAKGAFREHTLNSDFQSTTRMLFLHLAESCFINTAGVTGVTEILLVFRLVETGSLVSALQRTLAGIQLVVDMHNCNPRAEAEEFLSLRSA